MNKDQILNLENELGAAESVAAPASDDSANLMLAYSGFTLRRSRLSALAVVDDRGCLVPVFTAGDLLLALKAIWKETQY